MIQVRTLGVLFTLVTVSLIAACGGSATTSPGPVAGTYTLATVDGKNLPFTYFDSPELKREWVSPSTLTLGTDLSYRLILSTRITDEGTVSTEVDTTTGSYTASGGVVTLTSTTGTTRIGSWDGQHTLTVTGTQSLAFLK